MVETRTERTTQTTLHFIESTDRAQTWPNPFIYEFPLAHANGVMEIMNDERAFMISTQFTRSHEEGQVPLPETENYESKFPDGRLMGAYRNYRIRTSMWITFSADKGRTWTEPYHVDHSPMQGAWTWPGSSPFQLAGGTIVIPIAGYLSMDDLDGIWLSSGVLRSTDNAKTWHFVPVGSADRNEGLIFSEPTMDLLQDNHLLIMMRTECRVLEKDPRYEDLYGLYHSISADGGKTWTSPFRAMEGTHCSIVQLGDGNILCGHHLATRRDGKVLSVADPVRFSLSADAGRTWSTPRPWFTGRENLAGWYTNVEYVDENTAVAMIRDSPQNNRLWACRLLRKR